MQVEAIKELYDYNYWAMNKLLQAVEGLSMQQLHTDLLNGIGSIHTTLVHIVCGAWIWRTRWQGGMPTTLLQAEDFPTLQDIHARWQEEERQTRLFLATLHDDELAREVRYIGTMVPGKVFTQPLWKTMLHQINHQTQHRSEIAMRLTELGHSPGELGMSVFFHR